MLIDQRAQQTQGYRKLSAGSQEPSPDADPARGPLEHVEDPSWDGRAGSHNEEQSWAAVAPSWAPVGINSSHAPPAGVQTPPHDEEDLRVDANETLLAQPSDFERPPRVFSEDSAIYPLNRDDYFFIGGLRYLDNIVTDHFPLPITIPLDASEDLPGSTPGMCTNCVRRAHKFDSTISYTIHRLSLGCVFDTWLLIGAQAFSVWFVPLTFTLACVFLSTEWAMTLFVAGILTPILNSTLKGVFNRERPNPQRLGKKTYNLRAPLKNKSFPSGDSAEAGCWGIGMATATGSWIPLLAIPYAMLGRIYFGAHYVCDTIVGASLGVLVFKFVESQNDIILEEVEKDLEMRAWFRRFLVFCLIPATLVVVHYFWLCKKGLRG